MGLLTIIRKQRIKGKEMRLLMLGLDNAGKTTIVRRLKGGQDLSQVMPTLGFNIDTLIHKSYSLNIWDVGGQITLRPYWRNYFEATDAIIWVIDSTDRARLSDTMTELNQLLQEEVSCIRLASASLLVFANKQDLAGAMSTEEIETVSHHFGQTHSLLPVSFFFLNSVALDLKGKSNGHRWKVMPCSAISGMNVMEGLDWVVDEVAGRLYLLQ
ncbi:ADP-ribosylation factor-like 2 [Puccinia sorghi]|uniref:ADP-ribosylation factor n=1 Tax=Puccinia sorghi TaxID=27349 RepID=A0A0L6UCR1_9BASI|nr:ADP-ribosylation factor-like 2 [Puccinia sorghi]